jgi:uncharacterized membrane protein
LLAASPANVFLLLGTTIGILYLIATPPLLTPDELRHLRRTVQITHGGIADGATVPASLERLAGALRRDGEPAGRGSVGRGFPVQRLRAAAGVALEPDDTVYWPADRYVPYSPVAYLPAIATVSLALWVDARPLVILYLARLGLLCGGIAVLYAAIRLTPTLPWSLCWIALLPTASFVRSGVSADTLTTAFAFLLFALVMRLRAHSSPIGRVDVALLTAVATALALCKIGYLPLTLVTLALPAARFVSSRRRWQTVLVMVVVPLLATLLWLGGLADWAANDGHRRADAGAQLHLLLADPTRFLVVLKSTWIAPERLWHLANTFVGRILVLSIPPLLVAATLAACAVLSLVDQRDPGPAVGERLLFAAAVLASVATISLGLYLTWSAPGAPAVRGFQGRYFYPLAPFVSFALLPPGGDRSARAPALPVALVMAVALVANAWGIASVVAATWLGEP